ncbi:PEP-CTERM sorting domain-containing protein [Methylomonas sp. SURF-1]|uniref:PEP-CTERM sorting domain-containing protein n=1 Tax=Methylomonas aurea TaxID=2952224 RepID=A0ABT1UND6_9GAMM|nr:PEP-CTERM sorting domain-containing protein [Methylomonas sp. SURF-1]MCQ8182901.1 PEP-CTERM sorting domain-containing protein [Methylomonas sp. SURF-1]
MKYCLLGIFLTLASTGIAQANTIFVPSFGDSGLQTFNYTFVADFTGTVTIGVSDEGDSSIESYLDLPGYVKALRTNPASPADTANYANTQNEHGTDGELYTFALTALAGESFSFDWRFHTDDYHPFNDFAFVSLVDGNQSQVRYAVLAEVAAVPVPAAIWLFGSSLVGWFGLRRKA